MRECADADGEACADFVRRCESKAMPKQFHPVVLGLICVFWSGCGAGNPSASSSENDRTLESAIDLEEGSEESLQIHLASHHPNSSSETESRSKTGNISKTTAESSMPRDAIRKIIYTANLEMTVESFSGVADSMIQLSQEFGGFVAQANISGTTGNRRRGSWTLRIPSDQYRPFLTSAGSLGEIRSLDEHTKEVTAEFYDVDARIRNKQMEEARLNQILEERPGKLDDVLKVEREVSRVRQEIETMQGRLRVLKDLTSYSTVTITVSEIEHYAPPATPTFATLIQRQWDWTVANMTSTFQALILCTIAIGPWLVVLTIPATLILLMIRQSSAKDGTGNPIS